MQAIQQYIQENLFLNPNALTPISTAYGHYKVWAMKGAHPALTRNEFVAGLEALGHPVGNYKDYAVVMGLSFSPELRYKLIDGKVCKNPAYPTLARH